MFLHLGRPLWSPGGPVAFSLDDALLLRYTLYIGLKNLSKKSLGKKYMLYELIVLSLLMHWPLHGYVIARISNDMLGPWEKISKGTMYSLLGKLERSSLIQLTDPGKAYHISDRHSKTYEITHAGRQHFMELMLDTTSGLSNYRRLFHLKAMHLNFLPLDDQLYLVDHYRMYCQTAIRHQRTQAQEIQETPDTRAEFGDFFFEGVLDYLHSMTDIWQVELRWADRLRARIVASVQEVEPSE
jgi:DNA-binding PadR family transcriptional regulator